MKVEKIDHVVIRVTDLQKAKKFFADLLETKFIELGEFSNMDARSAIEPFGIELVEPLIPDGALAKEINRKGEGLSLLSLKVFNLEEAVAEMKSKGIRLITRIERSRMKAAVFHPKDTYGVMIELIEYKSKSPARVTARGE
jgi:methylmalonyl-CoA/ethylmalonyl-CoA epimerase